MIAHHRLECSERQPRVVVSSSNQEKRQKEK
jgi:hypothetical protein